MFFLLKVLGVLRRLRDMRRGIIRATDGGTLPVIVSMDWLLCDILAALGCENEAAFEQVFEYDGQRLWDECRKDGQA